MEQRIRTVLIVGPSCGDADALCHLWTHLGIQDKLVLIRDPRRAGEYLRSRSASAHGGRNGDDLAGVVLDTGVTGEETGDVLRTLRGCGYREDLPVIAYAGRGEGYGALVGCGLTAVIERPKLMPLICTLDELCGLRRTALPPSGRPDESFLM